MKTKVLYHIHSGTVSKGTKPFVYQFGHTTDIQMQVSKTGFTIEVFRTMRKDGAQLMQDTLFRDAIKKAYLIQLIKYGAMSKSSVFAEVDQNRYCLFDNETDKGLIYSLCGNKLRKSMSKQWGDNAVQRILDVTKSRANRLDVSLDALLMAKSKVYETERFMYLWMAMNGLYGYMTKEAEKHLYSKSEEKWLKNENGQLKFFSLIIEYPYCHVDKKQEDTLLRQLNFLLGKAEADQTEDTIQALKANDCKNEIIESIHRVLKEAGIETGKMHPYATLLLYLSYKTRCKYFHAEKNVPLMCFENEYPLPVLRVLNAVLEDFLDNNLSLWFDSEKLNTVLIPRIKEFAENCRCDKKNNNRLFSCIVNGEERA